MKIAIETQVNAALDKVWSAWTTPSDITAWNFAMEQWCCPRADINLTPGGRFNYRMEARDGSMGFDFEGEFTEIQPQALIRFKLGDDRVVSVEFIDTGNGIRVVETFDAEDENAAEQQRQGWLAILNNFKQHVESQG